MENLNLLFNKTYYDNLCIKDGKLFNPDEKRNNEILCKTEFDPKTDYCCSEIAKQTFTLKVGYPGLLIGTGNAHGVSSDIDYKCGFSFDYVTGQPYIPGSSVKGLIRSVFNCKDIIKEILKEETENDISDALLQDITDDIFENNDIFFDAVLTGSDKYTVLSDDYITPHKAPTKNPIPVHILKVSPGAIFEFRFLLNDTVISDENGSVRITAGKKSYIFKRILIEFGIGSKTNLGYGIFSNVKVDRKKDNPETNKPAPKDNNLPKRTDSGRKTHSGLDSLKDLFG